MGQIKVEKNVGGIKGLCVIEPAVHGDARGYFMETYNEKDMKEAGIDIHFVQDNQSMSTKGVLRGLHFQKQYPQCAELCLMSLLILEVILRPTANGMVLPCRPRTRSSFSSRRDLHTVSLF